MSRNYTDSEMIPLKVDVTASMPYPAKEGGADVAWENKEKGENLADRIKVLYHSYLHPQTEHNKSIPVETLSKFSSFI